MNAKKTNKNLSTFSVLHRLLKLVHGMECWMILAILTGTAGFVCAAGIGMMAVLAAFSHIPGSISISFGTACLCMGLFAVLRGVLRYGEQACNHYIAFRLLATIRDKVFGQLRRLGPARLDGRKKGDLIALITSDVELLEVFYAHTISPFCIAICCAVLFGAAGFRIHWSIGALLLCSYALAAFGIPLIFGSAAQKTGIARRKAVGDLSATVLENVRGADEIIQYDLEGVRKARMNEKTEELLVLEDEQKKQTVAASSASLAIVTLSMLFMLFLGLYLYRHDQIGAQSFFASLVLQSSTFGPFLALANLSTGLSSTLGAARRVLTLFDEEVTVRENEKGACPESSAMAVENLAFAYDDQAILESLSLSFPEGKITGIEGRSGCGQSTLLRLLMRFFDPQAGTARLGDENLKDVQTDFLRTKQSVVLQESVLFTDTLRNNLLAAKPDATDKEIRRACKKASIDTFIDSLDQGLDTMLAESGSSLSSGEKQRRAEKKRAFEARVVQEMIALYYKKYPNPHRKRAAGIRRCAHFQMPVHGNENILFPVPGALLPKRAAQTDSSGHALFRPAHASPSSSHGSSPSVLRQPEPHRKAAVSADRLRRTVSLRSWSHPARSAVLSFRADGRLWLCAKQREAARSLCRIPAVSGQCQRLG